MKILLNTISTKKHAGGAFQISFNFILKSLDHTDVEWYYITSQDVDDAIGEKFVHLRETHYFVFPTQPDFKGSYRTVKRQVAELEARIRPDVVYSITAPSYFTFIAPEVMRFTNPWVAHPNKYSWSTLTWYENIKTRLYCWNQRRMMKMTHFYITQSEATKQGIIRVTKEPSKHVRVVNNVLPATFMTMTNEPLIEDNWINIAAVGVPVPHKNLDIIFDLLIELHNLKINNIRFHTTIPFDHPLNQKMGKKLKAAGLMEHWVNYGRLSQQELGEMYRRCQFAFLPTLLEVFSASTVEAMYFNLPIVATSLQFNIEVLADSCLYYEPKNAKAAAAQFVKLFSDKRLQEELKIKMKKQLAIYGDYGAHFNAIKEFLLEVAENKIK